MELYPDPANVSLSNILMPVHITSWRSQKLTRTRNFTLFLLAALCGIAFPSPGAAYPAAAFAPGRQQAQIPMPWDQPPAEFKEVERQGFHAGVQAAIHDYNHHREPDAARRREFRKPPVQRSFAGDYRKGFQRGYNDAMRHMRRTNGGHS